MADNQQIILTPLQLENDTFESDTEIMITFRARCSMRIRVGEETGPFVGVEFHRFLCRETVPDARVDFRHDRFLDDLVAGMDKGPGGVVSTTTGGCPDLGSVVSVWIDNGSTCQQRVVLPDDFAFCLSLLSRRFTSRNHRRLESFSIFPAGRREVRVGLIRVFDERLPRLRCVGCQLFNRRVVSYSIVGTYTRKVNVARTGVDIHQEEAASRLEISWVVNEQVPDAGRTHLRYGSLRSARRHSSP